MSNHDNDDERPPTRLPGAGWLVPTRRDFFRLTAVAVGAGAACAGGNPADPGVTPDASTGGPDPDGSVVPPDARPPPPKRDLDVIPESAMFALGVMAGDADTDRAVLWTKYGGANTLVVYVQQAAGPAVLEGEVTPVDGGTVLVDVDGLGPGMAYVYAFVELDGSGAAVGRSRSGRFRTALAPDALEPVTFAGVSCTSQFRDVTSANLARLASRTDLSFALHAGDQLYADFPSDDPAMTLADYRSKYDFAWSRPGMAALHAATSMYTTWDDHEVYNDWQGYRDEPRIEAGVRSFFEHVPVRRPASAPRQLWRSVRWGRTLELFVLDCRSERDVAGGKYMSDAQLAWLSDGLRSSKAVFKFVLNSCPIGLFPPDTIDPWRSPRDRWANPAWSAQRTQVLDVSEAVGGVWWLSGDFHFGTVGRVQYPDTTRYGRVREVLMGAGGQGIGSNAEFPTAEREMNVRNLDNTNTHWTFATPANNYVVIRANPLADATHPTPWLDIAFYDATTQLFSGEYRLL